MGRSFRTLKEAATVCILVALIVVTTPILELGDIIGEWRKRGERKNIWPERRF